MMADFAAAQITQVGELEKIAKLIGVIRRLD